MALHKYRLQEVLRLEEESRHNLLVAARELIAKGNLSPRKKEALVLALGLEDNHWRTHKQVADLMHLSVERVRQLLLPSKVALGKSLKEGFIWPISAKPRGRMRKNYDSQGAPSSAIKPSAVTPWPRLPDIQLESLPTFQCPNCKVENPLPQNPILDAVMARALILKSHPLSGKDVRFLRQATGVNSADLATRLDITRQTLQNWETLPALRFVNDVAVRVVFAKLILSS